MFKNYKVGLVFVVFLFVSFFAYPDDLSLSDMNPKRPPRIIRTCCAFGYNVKVWGIPFYKMGKITSIDQLGEHRYLSDDEEENGIIYTQRGGFVDIGHLRDQADWTAYLYHQIGKSRGNKTEIKLGYEAGVKKLWLDIPADFSNDDALLLAGNITYYLSLWHEIATWYGASSVPFIPERYSSFSIEDDYSNRLGILLGMRAVKSELPFEQAMTSNLIFLLDTLKAVQSELETTEAMENVHGLWWTREYRYPSKKILIERDVPTFNYTSPMLLPQLISKNEPYLVAIPTQTCNNQLLADYFNLRLKLNTKIPVKKIFPYKKSRIINETDFEKLLKQIETKNKKFK